MLTSKSATIIMQSTSAQKLPLIHTHVCTWAHMGRPHPSPRAHCPPGPFHPHAQHSVDSKDQAPGTSATHLPQGTLEALGRSPWRKASWPACRILRSHSPLLQPPRGGQARGQAILHTRPWPTVRVMGQDPGHGRNVDNDNDDTGQGG